MAKIRIALAKSVVNGTMAPDKRLHPARVHHNTSDVETLLRHAAKTCRRQCD
jgi:hypothetical protein